MSNPNWRYNYISTYHYNNNQNMPGSPRRRQVPNYFHPSSPPYNYPRSLYRHPSSYHYPSSPSLPSHRFQNQNQCISDNNHDINYSYQPSMPTPALSPHLAHSQDQPTYSRSIRQHPLPLPQPHFNYNSSNACERIPRNTIRRGFNENFPRKYYNPRQSLRFGQEQFHISRQNNYSYSTAAAAPKSNFNQKQSKLSFDSKLNANEQIQSSRGNIFFDFSKSIHSLQKNKIDDENENDDDEKSSCGSKKDEKERKRMKATQENQAESSKENENIDKPPEEIENSNNYPPRPEQRIYNVVPRAAEGANPETFTFDPSGYLESFIKVVDGWDKDKALTLALIGIWYKRDNPLNSGEFIYPYLDNDEKCQNLRKRGYLIAFAKSVLKVKEIGYIHIKVCTDSSWVFDNFTHWISNYKKNSQLLNSPSSWLEFKYSKELEDLMKATSGIKIKLSYIKPETKRGISEANNLAINSFKKTQD